MLGLPEIEIGQKWALPPVERAGLFGNGCAKFYRGQLALMVDQNGNFTRWSAAASAALRAFYGMDGVSEPVFRDWLERVFSSVYDESPLEYVERKKGALPPPDKG